MKKTILLCYFAILNVSCSHMDTAAQRSPASQDTEMTCSNILSNLVTYGAPHFYTPKDFPDLSFEFLAHEPKLQQLIALHELKEHQDQAKIILALLKRKSPHQTAEGLSKDYLKLLKSCS